MGSVKRAQVLPGIVVIRAVTTKRRKNEFTRCDMKIIYFISLFISIITYVLGVQKVKYMFRKEFPDTVLEKHPWHDIVLIYMRVGVFMVCPVLNTIFAAQMLFDMDATCERTMESLRKKYSK